MYWDTQDAWLNPPSSQSKPTTKSAHCSRGRPWLCSVLTAWSHKWHLPRLLWRYPRGAHGHCIGRTAWQPHQATCYGCVAIAKHFLEGHFEKQSDLSRHFWKNRGKDMEKRLLIEGKNTTKLAWMLKWLMMKDEEEAKSWKERCSGFIEYFTFIALRWNVSFFKK